MSNSRSSSTEQESSAARSSGRRKEALRGRFARLRALRSAWGELAPSGLASEKQDIAIVGRSLSDDLMELASSESPDASDAQLGEIDARLDEFEAEMRGIALRVPVAQLRSTLPSRIEDSRRGVLDLLDLVLGAEIEGLAGTESRIATIDYLITLLCTNGTADGAPLQDPVTLTPRLYTLCEQSNVEYDMRLPEIEAAFFIAADMYEADVRDELSRRSLRDRKTELGASYFSPRILRAIVTYNAALLQRIDEEVSVSRDWGVRPAPAESREFVVETCDGSIFEAPAIREIALAVKRRLAGQAASVSDIDRVAWCLDLAYPDVSERKALRGESVGLREDPKGTAILAGLLCRSAVVLDDELPSIGISPARLAGEWVKELDDALKQEVNRLLAGDDHKEACLLSELKSKFLYAAMAEVHRKNRRRTVVAPVEKQADPADEAAKNLAREALEPAAENTGLLTLLDWERWPWARVGRIAALSVVACIAVVTIILELAPDAGLSRFSEQELAAVSPYLERGSRNLEGNGAAFVGTIDDAWLRLVPDARLEAAAQLVAVLQARGVTQIMVYDGERGLRIQAIGTGPVQVLTP